MFSINHSVLCMHPWPDVQYKPQYIMYASLARCAV